MPVEQPDNRSDLERRLDMERTFGTGNEKNYARGSGIYGHRHQPDPSPPMDEETAKRVYDMLMSPDFGKESQAPASAVQASNDIVKSHHDPILDIMRTDALLGLSFTSRAEHDNSEPSPLEQLSNEEAAQILKEKFGIDPLA